MSPAELADAIGMPRNNVKQLLFKMCRDGQVGKAGPGKYVHPGMSSDQDADNP